MAINTWALPAGADEESNSIAGAWTATQPSPGSNTIAARKPINPRRMLLPFSLVRCRKVQCGIEKLNSERTGDLVRVGGGAKGEQCPEIGPGDRLDDRLEVFGLDAEDVENRLQVHGVETFDLEPDLEA